MMDVTVKAPGKPSASKAFVAFLQMHPNAHYDILIKKCTVSHVLVGSLALEALVYTLICSKVFSLVNTTPYLKQQNRSIVVHFALACHGTAQIQYIYVLFGIY